MSDPRLSPDGSVVAFVASGSGAPALITVPSDGGAESVVAVDPPVRRGWGVFDWLPDGGGLVYVDAGGSLQAQPVGGGPPRALARTDGAASPAVSPDGDRVAYVADGRHVAVADLRCAGPWPVRLSVAPDFCVDPCWSPDGSRVAWHEWDVPAMAWDASRVVVADAGGSATSPGTRIAVPTPAPSAVAQPRFAPDGSALGFLCDGAGWLNLWQATPQGADPRVLVGEALEHGGPTWGPGARTWAWSPDGSTIAFTRNDGGLGELCLLDVAGGVVEALDRGVFTGLSWGAGRLAALRSGARTPDQVVVYPDPTSRPDPTTPPARRARITVAHGPVAGFGDAGMVEPEVVHWPVGEVAGVGGVAHGRLYRQRAGSVGPEPPLLVWVHGGPTGQHQVTFDARLAFLVDRGYNVLRVDPRGSTGWGRAYAQALNGRWGRLDVDDTVAAIHAAGREGWGDPARVALMGASSAGLTVLSVLARHPGLCAAGIDLYGVTDLFDLAESTHRFEAHYNPILLGALPAAAAEWRDRSPITHAGTISDPLLVLHGSADPVVSPSQSERLVAALQARGATVESHVYDGEGHGWSRPETVADELSRIDAFLTRYVLRGRRT